MSDPALLGLPATFEFDGAPYLIAHPRPFDAEAQFVVWLHAEAYKVLLPLRELLGAAEYAARVRQWHIDCASKVYAWGKSACVEALWSDEGVQQMAMLLFRYAEQQAVRKGACPERQMTPEMLRRIWADPGKRRELTVLVLGVDLEAGEAPNPKPPGESPSAA